MADGRPDDHLATHQPPQRPGARERGRMRRRLRQQRRVREALLLDLGALVFELHRHGRREPELLQAKAAELSAVDAEVRALADALEDETTLLELVASGSPAAAPSAEHPVDRRPLLPRLRTAVVPELARAGPRALRVPARRTPSPRPRSRARWQSRCPDGRGDRSRSGHPGDADATPPRPDLALEAEDMPELRTGARRPPAGGHI